MKAQLYYEKALRCYLLTKHTLAATNCSKAVSSLRAEKTDRTLLCNIWTLYINIATTLLSTSSSAEQSHVLKLLSVEYDGEKNSLHDTCLRIWKKVADEGYGGDVSCIESSLISISIAMAMKLQQPSSARTIAEEWFAALPDHVLQEIAEGNDKAGYNDIVDQYITRILPSMHDFDSALTFLEYNTVLPDTKKKTLRILISEKKQSLELERETKIKLEEARKLALEEKQRAEEEERRKQEKEEEEEEKFKRKEEAEQQTRFRDQLLAAQRQKEIAQKAEPQQSEELPAHNKYERLQSTSSRSSSYSGSIQIDKKTLMQKWMDKFSSVQLSKTSGGILIFIFALFALLRGQRGKLSIALQHFMYKLWETVKMGTKVTYI